MNKITRFFMERTVLFWSFMAIIIIAGVLAFINMPKLEDPSVAPKQAIVIIPYPGASAHEVEMNVAQLMEEELRTLPDVYKIKTDAQDGMATITVEFKMTVLAEDLEQHFDLLRRKVSGIESKLPAGTYSPIVMDDLMDVYGIFYALTGDGYSYPELEKYAKYIRRELSDIPGVKRISITGTRDETIDIILSKEELSRNGLIPTQIMMALQQASKPLNAGNLKADSENLRLRVSEGVNTVEDLKNLVIKTPSGKQIRLDEVATIERTLATPQRNGFFINGQPAIAIALAMEGDAIVPDVGDAVDKRLDEIMKTVPAGMKIDKIFFQPDKVNEAISSFMLNLLESVIIVILILIFTMGWRSGLIIGFGLVLTIALSFPILLQMGTTLQRISLGAFIVAMGMLVDNAVVIMDGILIDNKRGLKPDQYLYRIGKNTALPLLGATIIAAATFIAIYLSPDSAGEYAGDLFLVLCVSLLASWILALVQVPVCASAWLPKNSGEKMSSEETSASETPVLNSRLHQTIRTTIAFLIQHKWATIIIAAIVLGASCYGLTKVKNLFFPDFDYKQFVVECYFPSRTSPETVISELDSMARIVSSDKEIERVAVSTGAPAARYCLVRPMTSGGDCYGELLVDCKDYKDVVEKIPGIRKQLREKFPDAYIRIRKYNFSISSSHTVEVEFAGPDPEVLRNLSRQAEDIMRQCKYVDPYSVQNNWNPTARTLVADYNHSDALRAGVGREDVANALLAATDGMPVGTMTDGDKLMIVNLKVRNSDGSEIKELADIPVWSMMNVHIDASKLPTEILSGNASKVADNAIRTIPLGSVAHDIKLEWSENMVKRLNGRRVIEAECDPDPDNSEATPAKVLSEIKDKIDAIPLPPGYSRRWVGEGEMQTEATANVLKFMPITLFIIVIILLLLFNSWRKVILILICFPFVAVGIVAALLMADSPFTFMAIIGMMGLIGMMIKNAIVLVDEIGRLNKEEGLHPYHAVIEATVSRVRPVLMASLTTIVGMIPLIFDPMYGSMAITIMGGLTAGTAITLLLLPIFYTVLMKVKKPKTDKKTDQNEH
ncbi:MAG: efflux RND transporter permease subunit [Muribaculaceae bacterium]|nr:efflux RND transporter permease subunit [Muribaculaceae bacterium]